MNFNKKSLLAALALVVLAVIFLLPIFNNAENLGIRDWGIVYLYNGVARASILDYGQMPFWNPYHCGGNFLLAHPQATIFSPSYLFVLLFGVALGLKLQILFFFIVGALGAYFLARKLGAGEISSTLVGIVFAFSTVLTFYVVEGTSIYLAYAWIPWAIFFYYKSKESFKFSPICALFILLIFLDGYVYGFTIAITTLGLLALFDSIVEKKFKYIFIFAIIMVLLMLLGAFKFLPLYEVLGEVPKTAALSNEGGYTAGGFFTALFDRTQGPFGHPDILQSMKVGEWIYANMYIGVLTAIFAVLGILLFFKKKLPLLLTLLAVVIISFGNNSIINIYSLLKRVPLLYTSFYYPTRYHLTIILFLSLFAAFFLSKFEKTNLVINKKHIKKETNAILVGILILIVLVDLFFVSRGYLSKVFIAPPHTIDRSPQFYQTESLRTPNPYTDGIVIPNIYESVYGNKMYTNFLENKGTTNCYEHFKLKTAAAPRYLVNGTLNPLYRGEVYLEKGGNASISKFTPNEVTVNVNAASSDILVLNQNYYTSWRAKGGSGDAFNYNGLVAVPVSASTKQVVFYQYSKSFVLGLIVSIIAIILALLVYFKFDKLREKFKFLKFDF